MRLTIPWLLLFASACGGTPATPSSLRPSDVVEYASLPPGYTLGARLSEGCTGVVGIRAIEREALLDVDCSPERITRVLHARAAAQGKRLLVERSCRSVGSARFKVQCSAAVAEPSQHVALGAGPAAEAAPAPSPAQVLDLDEPRPQYSAEIRVSFLPLPEARRWAARGYDRVAETAQPAVGRRGLGQVSAICRDCAPAELRHALRVTAGRMGAGEVATVRCFQDDDDQRCVATALEPWSY
jgi:hypothetical protein